jgi:hypothetical protein
MGSGVVNAVACAGVAEVNPKPAIMQGRARRFQPSANVFASNMHEELPTRRIRSVDEAG